MDMVSSGKNSNYKNIKKSRILEENFVAVEIYEDVMEEIMRVVVWSFFQKEEEKTDDVWFVMLSGQ